VGTLVKKSGVEKMRFTAYTLKPGLALLLPPHEPNLVKTDNKIAFDFPGHQEYIPMHGEAWLKSADHIHGPYHGKPHFTPQLA
jgi:hypothetical protein